MFVAVTGVPASYASIRLHQGYSLLNSVIVLNQPLAYNMYCCPYPTRTCSWSLMEAKSTSEIYLTKKTMENSSVMSSLYL